MVVLELVVPVSCLLQHPSSELLLESQVLELAWAQPDRPQPFRPVSSPGIEHGIVACVVETCQHILGILASCLNE